jgi:hypothetical protein
MRGLLGHAVDLQLLSLGVQPLPSRVQPLLFSRRLLLPSPSNLIKYQFIIASRFSLVGGSFSRRPPI